MAAPAVVARRPAAPGAPRSRRSAASAGGRATSPRCSGCYEEALAIWQGIGDDRELANALLQRVVLVRGRPGRARSAPATPRARARRYVRRGPRGLPPDRRRARRGERPVGPRDHALLPGRLRDGSEREYPQRAGALPGRRATGRWRAGRGTCSDWRSSRQRRDRGGEGPRRPRGPPFPRGGRCRRAVADPLRPVRRSPSRRATSSGPPGFAAPRQPLERDRARRSRVLDRGRVRGRAGAGRASASRCPLADVERLGAEGAAMTLDEVVAYALEGAPPDEDDEA